MRWRGLGFITLSLLAIFVSFLCPGRYGLLTPVVAATGVPVGGFNRGPQGDLVIDCTDGSTGTITPCPGSGGGGGGASNGLFPGGTATPSPFPTATTAPQSLDQNNNTRTNCEYGCGPSNRATFNTGTATGGCHSIATGHGYLIGWNNLGVQMTNQDIQIFDEAGPSPTCSISAPDDRIFDGTNIALGPGYYPYIIPFNTGLAYKVVNTLTANAFLDYLLAQ